MSMNYTHRSTDATEFRYASCNNTDMLFKVVCKISVSNSNYNFPLVFIRISKLMLPLRKHLSQKAIGNTIQQL